MACPPDSVRAILIGLAGEVGAFEHAIDLGFRRSLHTCEVAQIRPHTQIVVDAGRLSHVADPVAQRSGPGRTAQHVHLPTGDDLDTDDGAHERRLPAAAGSEEPDDRSAGHVEVKGVDDGRATAADREAAHLDRIIHHLLNETPGAV